MSGKRYGSLMAIKSVGRTKRSHNIIWQFKCDCGTVCSIDGYSVRSGKTISCKKCSSERIRLASVKHGMTNSYEFSTWTDIKTRCYNKNSTSFANYGGRGIKVCDKWLESFEDFLSDMGVRPSRNHSIDRIDVDGDYTPNNCRWATAKEQANNKRSNHMITINRETKTLQEWANLYRLSPTAILLRERKGLEGKALIAPSSRGGTITFNGVTDTFSGWEKRTGIKASTISMRLSKYKWPLEKALTVGVRH